LQAIASSVNVLSNSYKNLHCFWLRPLAQELDQTPLTLVQDIQSGRGYDVSRVGTKNNPRIIKPPT